MAVSIRKKNLKNGFNITALGNEGDEPHCYKCGLMECEMKEIPGARGIRRPRLVCKVYCLETELAKLIYSEWSDAAYDIAVCTNYSVFGEKKRTADEVYNNKDDFRDWAGDRACETASEYKINRKVMLKAVLEEFDRKRG